MKRPYWKPIATIALTAVLLTACASTGSIVSAPGVTLRNVEVANIDFSGQTFVLGFDVTNPNPFPLPIREISYGVQLDGQRFASGTVESGFSVPAGGDSEFAISVELDLMRTAPQLLHLLHDGVGRDIPYTLDGQFGIDLPYVKPVAFRAAGEIRLTAVSL
jgi:LEA14-like dessication related protein